MTQLRPAEASARPWTFILARGRRGYGSGQKKSPVVSPADAKMWFARATVGAAARLQFQDQQLCQFWP